MFCARVLALPFAHVLAIFSIIPVAQAAPLGVKFKNTSGLPDSQVYIGFVGAEPLSATNTATNTAIAKTQFGSENWYTLDTLPQGLNLTSFSGRIYVGYGSPWNFTHAGYEPSPVATTDPNYLKRYDKVEITYHGNAADVANTTSFDYFSIPVGLNVYQGGTSGTLVKSLNASPTSVTLAAMETIANPQQAAVVRNASNNFVRVIGPSVYPPPPGVPASPYDNLDGYLDYLYTYGQNHGNVIARVKGHFNGVGSNPVTAPTKPQDYNFTVSIDAQQNVIVTGNGSLVGNHTLMFTQNELNNPAAIYGANPGFQLDGAATTPTNDIYGWIIADLFAGLNIGAVGSTVEVNGQQVGLMDSQQWFTLTQRFAALQPNQPYYNQWAAKMSQISDAYNFAYTDRFAHVVAPLNPAQVDTLEIVFLTESPTVTLPGDYNKNGVVDAADYVVWRNGLGTAYTQSDYNTWRTHFGQTAGSASAPASGVSIPEPAAVVYLAASISLSLTITQRRRGSRYPSPQR